MAGYHINSTLDAKMVLHKLISTLENDYNIKKKYSFAEVESETIDNIINREVNELQYRCAAEEAEYIKQKLIEYPAEVFRKYNRKSIDSSPKSTDNSETIIIKKKRIESCRKSRLNAKLKHAKSKFSYEYIDQKVKKDATILKAIYEVISHAENNLIAGGLHPFAVMDLRLGMGMKGIDEIFKIDNIDKEPDYNALEQKKENNYFTSEINTYELAALNQKNALEQKKEYNYLTGEINEYELAALNKKNALEQKKENNYFTGEINAYELAALNQKNALEQKKEYNYFTGEINEYELAALNQKNALEQKKENNYFTGEINAYELAALNQKNALEQKKEYNYFTGEINAYELAALNQKNALEQKKEYNYFTGEINAYELNQGMRRMNQIVDIGNYNYTYFEQNKNFEMMEIPHNQILSYCN